MREEVLARLTELIEEKQIFHWKDGWVYGKLKQKFDLQLDELEEMVRLLGFKKGWNPIVESLLEEQWEKEQRAEEALERARATERSNIQAAYQVLSIQKTLQSYSPKEKYTDVEMALFKLILEMNSTEQHQLLTGLVNRRKH